MFIKVFEFIFIVGVVMPNYIICGAQYKNENVANLIPPFMSLFFQPMVGE